MCIQVIHLSIASSAVPVENAPSECFTHEIAATNIARLALFAATTGTEFRMSEYNLDKDEVIRRAMRFPLEPVLRRYMKYYGVSEEEAREHEVEMKRYLVVCALSEGTKFYAVQPPIDNFWHTFIIFTQLYTEFCNTIAGRYIHHTPAEACTLPKAEMFSSYNDLFHDYALVFNSEAPAHIWSRMPEMEEFSDGYSYSPPCC
jgi:hypothetical protein